MEEQEIFNKRKEKIIKWLKNNYNLCLLGIVLIALLVRLYYFVLTKDQAHWWDSLAYGSIAKDAIYHLWSGTSLVIHEKTIRPFLLPFLWSIFLRFNLSDSISIFFLEIIPSIVSVIFIYLVGKEMFNKKIALISAFILSVLWVHLFYSMRIMTDVPSLMFILISMYFFVKSYPKMEFFGFMLSIFFLSLAIFMRYPSGLVGIVFFIFLFSVKKFSLFKNKSFWKGGILGSILLIIFFIKNKIVSDIWFPAIGTYVQGSSLESSYAFYTIYRLIPHILQKPFLVFFLLGLIIAFFQLILGFGFLSKIKKLRSNLFLIILLIISLSFFIFWLKIAEDRYLFVCLPALIIFTSTGILYSYELIKKYEKKIAVIFLIAILFLGAYTQFNFGDSMIKERSTSYSQMKQGFEWIKQNTLKNAVILGQGIDPYAIFYAERKYIDWVDYNGTSTAPKVDYAVLHRFEHQSQEFIDYVSSNPSKFAPIQGIFFDQEGQQPAVIIYQVR